MQESCKKYTYVERTHWSNLLHFVVLAPSVVGLLHASELVRCRGLKTQLLKRHLSGTNANLVIRHQSTTWSARTHHMWHMVFQCFLSHWWFHIINCLSSQRVDGIKIGELHKSVFVVSCFYHKLHGSSVAVDTQSANVQPMKCHMRNSPWWPKGLKINPTVWIYSGTLDGHLMTSNSYH